MPFSTAAPGDGCCHSPKRGAQAQRVHAPAQGRPAAKCPGIACTSASWLSAWLPESLESLRFPPQPTPHPPRPSPGPALNCNPEDPQWISRTGSASHPGLRLWKLRAGLCNCPVSLRVQPGAGSAVEVFSLPVRWGRPGPPPTDGGTGPSGHRTLARGGGGGGDGPASWLEACTGFHIHSEPGRPEFCSSNGSCRRGVLGVKGLPPASRQCTGVSVQGDARPRPAPRGLEASVSGVRLPKIGSEPFT